MGFVEAMRRQVGLSPGWLCVPPATRVTSPLHEALAGGSSSFTAPGFYSAVEPESERALACSSGWLAVQQELSAAEVAQGPGAVCWVWGLISALVMSCASPDQSNLKEYSWVISLKFNGVFMGIICFGFWSLRLLRQSCKGHLSEVGVQGKCLRVQRQCRGVFMRTLPWGLALMSATVIGISGVGALSVWCLVISIPPGWYAGLYLTNMGGIICKWTGTFYLWPYFPLAYREGTNKLNNSWNQNLSVSSSCSNKVLVLDEVVNASSQHLDLVKLISTLQVLK